MANGGKKKGKQRLVEINDKIQAVIMHVVQLKYDLNDCKYNESVLTFIAFYSTKFSTCCVHLCSLYEKESKKYNAILTF